MAGFVNFAVLEGGEEESFEGEREASVFFVVRTDVRADVFEFTSLEILSVLEFIRSVALQDKSLLYLFLEVFLHCLQDGLHPCIIFSPIFSENIWDFSFLGTCCFTVQYIVLV